MPLLFGPAVNGAAGEIRGGQDDVDRTPVQPAAELGGETRRQHRRALDRLLEQAQGLIAGRFGQDMVPGQASAGMGAGNAIQPGA